MRWRIPLCVLVTLVAAARLSAGQGAPQVVQARMLLGTDAVHASSDVKTAVEAQIASGYHINDHHPTLDYLIPTEVKFDPSKQITAEKVLYPKGDAKKFAFAEQPLSVYEGTLLVSALVRIAPGIAPGNYSLKGKLTYQACNEQACLPPASVPLALTVKVVDRKIPLKRVNADVFNKLTLN